MNVVWLLAGLAMLYVGAEWLVGGASGLALAMRIPQIIVGLTVVAYGTSAPEVVVGIQAASSGHAEVALGNVVGSNIANIGLILGVSALARPTRVLGALRRRELPVLVASTLAVPAFLWDGVLAAWEAGALVLGAVSYTVWTVRSARAAAVVGEARTAVAVVAAAADVGGAPAPRGRPLPQGLTTLVGLGVLLAGGHLFVDAAVGLARSFGLDERIVGLTIVAIGTSLPELSTSLIAAARGHSDIVVGNVVGSNIFNVLLCLGSAGLVGRIVVDPRVVALDLVVLAGMTAAAVVFMRTERTLRRLEGVVLLVAYLAYLAYLVAS